MIVPRAGFSGAEKECEVSIEESAELESIVKLQKMSEQKKRKNGCVFTKFFFLPHVRHTLTCMEVVMGF